MEAQVTWDTADARMLRAWANEDDTTEAGAYGCALAAIELSEGLVAMRRALESVDVVYERPEGP